MNKEQQRIAIAEACGWKWLDHPDTLERTKTFQLQRKWVLSPDDKLEFPHDAPDYLNDLNAMHESENSLPESLHFEYTERLRVQIYHGWTSIRSTAAMRAQAFLKTLNLWEWGEDE